MCHAVGQRRLPRGLAERAVQPGLAGKAQVLGNALERQRRVAQRLAGLAQLDAAHPQGRRQARVGLHPPRERAGREAQRLGQRRQSQIGGGAALHPQHGAAQVGVGQRHQVMPGKCGVRRAGAGQHQQLLQVGQCLGRQAGGQRVQHQRQIAVGPGGRGGGGAGHQRLVKAPVHRRKLLLQRRTQPPGGCGALAAQPPAGSRQHHARAVAPQLGAPGQRAQGLYHRGQLLQRPLQLVGRREPQARHQHHIGLGMLQRHGGGQRGALPGGHGQQVHPRPADVHHAGLRTQVGGACHVRRRKQAGGHAARVEQQCHAQWRLGCGGWGNHGWHKSARNCQSAPFSREACFSTMAAPPPTESPPCSSPNCATPPFCSSFSTRAAPSACWWTPCSRPGAACLRCATWAPGASATPWWTCPPRATPRCSA